MNDRFKSKTDDPRRDNGMVERLLELADPGPEIPPDGADRIKAAIRPQWERQLNARRWRRRLVVAGGLAAGLVLALGAMWLLGPFGGGPAHGGPVAMVEALVGPTGMDSGATAVRVGDAVSAGAWIDTGVGGRIALRLTGGESLRLDERSRVRLASASEVVLEHGAVYIDSPEATGDGLVVETPLGTVREIGTQFEVRHDRDPLVVRVREGAVVVTTDREEIEVDRRSGVTIASDGAVTRTDVGPTDPAWNWILEVAPPFELEGATVTAFLEWVSRETGVEVDLETPELETFARKTVLHGSLAGLSPAEAPEVVLPSCGLVAVRDVDRLIIRPARE